MTEFIESFATQQLLPPWEARGARTWGFAIRMSVEKIQAYLDAYFNGFYPDRAPYHYTPVPGPQFGLLGTGHFPRIASLNKRTASRLGDTGTAWDHLHHTEVYLAFPVLRYDLTADNLLLPDPTLVWVEPFIFSDNDSVVFSSREIWGSDMYLASITREVGGGPHRLHLDLGMFGIKTFNPRSMTELLAVLHISTGDVSAAPIADFVAANPDLKGFLEILAGSGAFVGERPTGVGPSPFKGGRELNNLKQFRDCYDMAAATYRAIVASETTHTEVSDIVLFDPSAVEIDFMWSDSIGDLLKALLDADKPTDLGPPLAHAKAAAAGPKRPPAPAFVGPPPEHFPMPLPITPNAMDWAMDRVAVKAEFGFAFSSNVRFEVMSTIHTYGLAPGAGELTPPAAPSPAP
jgi:hypothetical protein